MIEVCNTYDVSMLTVGIVLERLLDICIETDIQNTVTNEKQLQHFSDRVDGN